MTFERLMEQLVAELAQLDESLEIHRLYYAGNSTAIMVHNAMDNVIRRVTEIRRHLRECDPANKLALWRSVQDRLHAHGL